MRPFHLHSAQVCNEMNCAGHSPHRLANYQTTSVTSGHRCISSLPPTCVVIVRRFRRLWSLLTIVVARWSLPITMLHYQSCICCGQGVEHHLHSLFHYYCSSIDSDLLNNLQFHEVWNCLLYWIGLMNGLIQIHSIISIDTIENN